MQMMKIGEVIRYISESLTGLYDKVEAKQIAYVLTGHVLGITKTKLLSETDTVLNNEQEEKINASLDELKTHKPIQYVLGTAMFFDCRIRVNKDVLIPRPETEELVKLIINDNKKRGTDPIRILDIGTGSGCISIALKKHIPHADVHACDISATALSVARENAYMNKVKITFHEFNILKPMEWPSMKSFDLIVSNPPYVTESEKKRMKKNVTDFEPSLALFVPDDDPIKYYSSIAAFSYGKLKPRGWLYLEINEALSDDTSAELTKHDFSDICQLKDIYEKDRFISCRKP
jgi:release factor glutamine methyltransferase